MMETRATEHTLEEHRTVRVVRRVHAAPERIFDVWLDPTRVPEWMTARGDQDQMVSVAIEPRVGGSFSFVVKRDGMNLLHGGEYLAVDRPRRLSFTWRVPRVSLETSVVTIELSPVDGETEMKLAHEGVFPELESLTEADWRSILDSVAALSAPEPSDEARAPR